MSATRKPLEVSASAAPSRVSERTTATVAKIISAASPSPGHVRLPKSTWALWIESPRLSSAKSETPQAKTRVPDKYQRSDPLCQFELKPSANEVTPATRRSQTSCAELRASSRACSDSTVAAERKIA